ncbi:hypothetical protein KP509_23G076000 [Ceratopteris richardii]|uniref:Uncharacterized protein n=1 Tax=Ceratopteris richardii TaxID=49495 RepID=A0A8T2S3V4_CERRI|nr:hypothetical protein KP509_23G076000 [Ceratopteris richardii]KAH7302513.1 hypothetical protein KP509_23G076000 [Ceratopteris richardii]KAH7302515.1 hypothetical protein KP509_23G076000 [Ceratopteris richardii]
MSCSRDPTGAHLNLLKSHQMKDKRLSTVAMTFSSGRQANQIAYSKNENDGKSKQEIVP